MSAPAAHARASRATRMECGICWHVYDPAMGDAVSQIPAGTGFNDLPEDWSCPECTAPKLKFMPLPDESAAGLDVVAIAETVAAAYCRAEPRLAGLPVHNPALRVETTGFRMLGDAVAGVAITPWMMVVVRVAADGVSADGEAVERAFPAGGLPMIAGSLDGVGRIETCSLFSPMAEFADQEAARLAACAAIDALFTAPEAEPEPQPAAPPRSMSRRALFTARSAA
jgi:[NiFe] hydrogenase assembly HybE family chaperone